MSDLSGFAYDEIQAKDSSFNLKLVLANEQSTKTVVGPQTKKLIENDGARIILGSVASSNTMEAALVCKNAGIPLLTPASTNDDLTDKLNDAFDRVWALSEKQGMSLRQAALVAGINEVAGALKARGIYP